MHKPIKILRYSFLALALLLALNAWGQVNFDQTAVQWGIEHYHRGMMGGGVAIFDFNNDGFEDIYLTGGMFQDQLFKNNGNQSFTKVSEYAGLSNTSNYNTLSVTAGDINNDGFKDLFIGTGRGQENLLYLNNGDNTFSDISSNSGITKSEWTMGATFGDFNLDGYLDVYILNYIQEERLSFDDQGEINGFDHDCYPNSLYVNNGDLTFTEIGSVSNTNNVGCGLATAATDLNNDHLPDLYVANDFGEWIVPNTCFINNYPVTEFTDLSSTTGLDAAIYGMGIAIGDYNRDGSLDYYVSNLGSNVLYQNDGSGIFTNVAQESGVLNTYVDDRFATSWGTAFFDYDLDGFEDLFVSNGFVPAAGFIGTAKSDPNKLYRNRGDGTFEDVSMIEGLDDPKVARGMAVGDLNNDGDLDLVVAIIGENDEAGNTLVYENIIESPNHWLKVILSGVDANRDGYGAKVKVYSNNEIWLHEIDGGSSHASHSSSIAHFGLGQVETIDSLVVIWPGGKKQKFDKIKVDQALRIEENSPSYQIAGCMQASATNFNADATFDYGCFVSKEGCLDQESPNFNIEANVESGNCSGVITAIADHDPESIFVFPNPMQDYVSIELPGHFDHTYNLRLVDMSGATLRSANFTESYMLRKDGLRSGIYLLQVVSKKRAFTTKIIVQ